MRFDDLKQDACRARTSCGSRPTVGTALLLAIIALIGAGNASCEQQGNNAALSPKTVRVALVGPGLNDSSWPVLVASADWFRRVEEHVEIDVMAPDRSAALPQREMLEGLRDGRHDVVCVMPYDPIGMAAVIDDLVLRGKMVITLGSDVPDSHRFGYCGPSEMEIGRSAAIACTKVLEGRPKTIMLLHGNREQDAANKRLVGFENEIKNYPDLQVLKELDCKGNAPDALHAVRVEHRKYPRTGCWVFLDDWPFGSLPAGDRMLPLGSGIVLCHTSSEYFRLVDNGQILALITYDLRETVDASLFLAIEAAEAKLQSQTGSARNVHVACEIVTGAKMTDFRAKWVDWTRPDYREMP